MCGRRASSTGSKGLPNSDGETWLVLICVSPAFFAAPTPSPFRSVSCKYGFPPNVFALEGGECCPQVAFNQQFFSSCCKNLTSHRLTGPDQRGHLWHPKARLFPYISIANALCAFSRRRRTAARTESPAVRPPPTQLTSVLESFTLPHKTRSRHPQEIIFVVAVALVVWDSRARVTHPKTIFTKFSSCKSKLIK